MVRFIITGLPRSGTTVICGSLITHPEISFYGELFNDMMGVRRNEAARLTLGAGWKIGNVSSHLLRPCEEQESGYQYLDKFYSLDISVKAVGFKILYDQALKGPNSEVWRYIADHPEIRIIRTQRENLLEIVCSYVRARITRRWHIFEESIKSPRFILPAHECESLFQRFTQTPEAFGKIEKTHQVLDIEYTDIGTNFTGIMAGVFSFLEVNHEIKTKPLLNKIARLSPNDEIVNYQELRDHFQNTPYSQFFIY